FLDVYRGLARDPASVAHLWLTPKLCIPAFALAYFFFLVTFGANIAVVYYGIRGGIERVCKIAMPALVIMGLALAVRILTLGKPEVPAGESWHVLDGLGFLWNPDFTLTKTDPATGATVVTNRLLDAKIWLAAAGQIFFTLSVGFGVILTYASYLRRQQDVVLSGLTSATANEFVEVILGGTIIIPAAFAFFGPQKIVEIAQSGTFDLGLVTMPLICEKIPAGQFFAVLWFALLFLAGITSSISLAQPAIAFLEDEFDLTKKEAVQIFGLITFILCQPVIFLLGQGAMDEMDFWGVNVCLVLFAGAEVVLFAWVFGIDRAWDEMHAGADLR
ncbi:MAG: sodium:calcium symporter, partial [Planctomycetota bacterium]|nr:sodium:calcium symporter [Planctomycetota bacterium]